VNHNFIKISSKKYIGQDPNRILANKLASLLNYSISITAFANAMATPIRRSLDYKGIASKFCTLQPMPKPEVLVIDAPIIKDFTLTSNVSIDSISIYKHKTVVITSKKKIQRQHILGLYDMLSKNMIRDIQERQ
jgi:hypothetical protein